MDDSGERSLTRIGQTIIIGQGGPKNLEVMYTDIKVLIHKADRVTHHSGQLYVVLRKGISHKLPHQFQGAHTYCARNLIFLWKGFAGLVTKVIEKNSIIPYWRGWRDQGKIMLIIRHPTVSKYGCCTIRNFSAISVSRCF